MPSDNFTITFHRHVSGKEQVSLVDPQYLPRRHGEAWASALSGSILATSPPTAHSVLPVPADGFRASIRQGRRGRGGFWRRMKVQGFELGQELQFESLAIYFSHSRKDFSKTLGRTSSSSLDLKLTLSGCRGWRKSLLSCPTWGFSGPVFQ